MSVAGAVAGRRRSHKGRVGWYRLVRRLDRLESVLGGAALILSFVIVLIGIVSREVLGRPVVWSEELARLAFVYVVFIGMSEAHARRTHLRVEAIDLVFGARAIHFMRLVTDLIIAALAVFLVWYGWEQAARSHMLTSLVLSWPLSITFAALPFAAFLMLLRTPFMVRREWRAMRRAGRRQRAASTVRPGAC